jgi:hypothetical protein
VRPEREREKAKAAALSQFRMLIALRHFFFATSKWPRAPPAGGRHLLDFNTLLIYSSSSPACRLSLWRLLNTVGVLSISLLAPLWQRNKRLQFHHPQISWNYIEFAKNTRGVVAFLEVISLQRIGCFFFLFKPLFKGEPVRSTATFFCYKGRGKGFLLKKKGKM